MHDLIGNLPVAIYEITVHPDGNSRIDFISESCERILGIPKDVVLTDREIFARVMHPDDLPEFLSRLKVAYDSGTEFNSQARIFVDGVVRWIEVTSTHQAQSNGVIKRYGLVQDVTFRRARHEEELLRYRSLEA